MVVEIIINFILAVISSLGYAGVFILTAMESMVLPMPTEILMPLVGFLVVSGKFNLLTVIILSALGALFGSLISYWIGQNFGRKLILKYGKYLLLDESHMVWTEKWFKKKGEKTVLISRFLPIVKHIISIPAGMGKMNPIKFSLYTFTGAGLWNVILIFMGMKLKQNWDIVHTYSFYLDIAALLIIGYLVFWFYTRNHRKKQ